MVTLLLMINSAPQSLALDSNESNFSECESTNYSPFNGKLNNLIEYITFSAKLGDFDFDNTAKNKQKRKALVVEKKKLNAAISALSSKVECASFSQEQWAQIKEDRINSQKNGEDLILKLMNKYPLVTINCYKNGIPREITGLKPLCPKGFKQI